MARAYLQSIGAAIARLAAATARNMASGVGGALLMLLAGVVHNNGHKWAPADLSGRVYLITGALLISALAICIGLHKRQASVWLAVALLVGWQLQAVVANVWWIIAPWPVQPGGELLSDRLHMPLGTLGLWAAAMVAQHLHNRGARHGHQ